VAVVIPCYRVAQHIAGVIRSIPPEVSEIILVDDASPDRVVAKARATGDPRLRVLRHARNRGVGGAMVTGYRESLQLGADVIVKVDGDGQMDLTQLPALVEPLLQAEADYTKGNRWCHTAALARMPWRRRWGNLLLSFATKMVSGYWRVFDPCNGYTAIRASTLRLLSFEHIASGYFFETSMLVELAIERATVRDVFLPCIYGEEKAPCIWAALSGNSRRPSCVPVCGACITAIMSVASRPVRSF
jgi:glycosyltransferase involved in cell wall biosynthesis